MSGERARLRRLISYVVFVAALAVVAWVAVTR